MSDPLIMIDAAGFPVTLAEQHTTDMLAEQRDQREDAALVQRAMAPVATRFTATQAEAFARLVIRRAERRGNVEGLLFATGLQQKLTELAAAGLEDDLIVEVRSARSKDGWLPGPVCCDGACPECCPDVEAF